MMCALVAYACADVQEDKENCCSMEDRLEMIHEWETVWSAEFTGRRVLIAQELFSRLFEKDGTTQALFKNVGGDDVNSALFKAHCVRITDSIDTIVHMASYTDVEHQLLDHLGDQHAHYDGVLGSHFKLFRECFLEVLPQAIPCFNSGAWGRCLKVFQDEIALHLPH